MVVAKSVVRVGFGLAIALVGVAHYMDAHTFAEAVGRGLEYPWLENVGMVWGYLLPGLMIVGGVLIAIGYMPAVGSLVAGVALVSIPVGLMLKSVLSGLSLNDTMPPAMNAIVWVLFYVAAVRGLHGPHCDCGPHHAAPVAAPRPVVPAKAPVAPAPKPAMPAPKVIAKAPAKKTVGKKR